MSRKLLRKLLQEKLVLVFLDRGFEQLSLPSRERKSREMSSAFPLGRLVRPSKGVFDLVNVQIHSRRAAFVLNFGIADPEKTMHPWGQFRGRDTMVSDLATQCRLYSSRTFMIWFGESWFTFGSGLESHLETAIDRAIDYCSEVESYFSTEIVGPHVKCILYSGDASAGIRATVKHT